MKYTETSLTPSSHVNMMLRNYSKLLSFEDGKYLLGINFEKTFRKSNIMEFEYFTKPIPAVYSPFILSEGDIFSPISNKNVTYIILNGVPSIIPNRQTVEVLLFQRGLSIEDIKLLEDTEIYDIVAYNNGSNDLPTNSLIPGVAMPEKLASKISSAGGGGSSTPVIESKESEWTPDMSLTSISEQFAELAGTAASAETLLTDSLNQMQQIVDLATEEAQTAKAQAEAAALEAQAAIAQAEAAQAQAEAEKAEFESKNNQA
jgi:hypothetical protein